MNNIIKVMDTLKEIKGYVEVYMDIEECAVGLLDDYSIIIGNKENYATLDVRAFNSVEEMIIYVIDYFRSKED